MENTHVILSLARISHAYSWAVCLTGELRSLLHKLLGSQSVAPVAPRSNMALTLMRVDTTAVVDLKDKIKQLFAAWPELHSNTMLYSATDTA